MFRKLPASDHQSPAAASPVPGSAEIVDRRQLEKPVSWSGRERRRFLWYRLRLTVAEMNYASRRLTDPRAGLSDGL